MSKSFTINDLPKEERPRERLVKFGEQALSAQELLQLILGRGIAGESVAVTAQKLLTQFGSLQKLAEASIEELSSIKGIGLAKAAQIKAAFEIGRRFSTQVPSYKSKELTDPEKVYRLIKSKLKDYHKENFYIIALNNRNHSIAEVSIGSLNASIVHPREVFAEASVSTIETNMKSTKCLPMQKGSSLAKKSYYITVQILFWTSVYMAVILRQRTAFA